MTEREAQRIVAEHRAECPDFYRGGRMYRVRRDGKVDVYRLTRADHAVFLHTSEPDDYTLHPDVRKRLQ